MKTIKDFDLEGKKVLVRVDFNEPLDAQGNPLNEYRIESILPTLEYLLDKKCTLILMTHLGRPAGKVVENLRTNGVALALEKLLKRPVIKLDECVGEKVRSTIGNREADVYFLENLRFHIEEEENDEGFASSLAKLADFYVNDAFANCHRDHASMTGVPKFLPGAIGFLVEKEIKMLGQVRNNPKHPFTFVLGGAKLITKIKLLKEFLQKSDNVLVGGKIANTLLKADGVDVGASDVEGKVLSEAHSLLPKIADAKLHLPVDVSVSKEVEKEEPQDKPDDSHNCAVSEIGTDEIIYDIGPRTVEKYKEIIKKSDMVLWNGPMGYFEHMHFKAGTQGIVSAMIAAKGDTIIGGGETVDFLDDVGARDKITFVSTGGGAMLDYLADGELVALNVLE